MVAHMVICKGCGTHKEIGEFYGSSLHRGGDTGVCKECVKAKVTAYRAENIESIRQYDRERSQLEHRLARNREASRLRYIPPAKWRADHPQKYRAHIAVKSALRSGRLVKPSVCEDCGEEKRLEGHHDDYSKVLDVRWLCRQCHGAHHRALNEKQRRAA